MLEALDIVYHAHGMNVEGLADWNGKIRPVVGDGKSGRWGGARSKGEGRECVLDRKMLLHSDILNLCLKQKRNITEFFPDTIVFSDKNNFRCKAMG